MIAKDLVVLGDVMILGRLHADSYVNTTKTTIISNNARMVAAGADNSNPQNEGEVVWEYE